MTYIPPLKDYRPPVPGFDYAAWFRQEHRQQVDVAKALAERRFRREYARLRAERIVKHLPGLHNQKSHGNQFAKTPWLFDAIVPNLGPAFPDPHKWSAHVTSYAHDSKYRSDFDAWYKGKAGKDYLPWSPLDDKLPPPIPTTKPQGADVPEPPGPVAVAPEPGPGILGMADFKQALQAGPEYGEIEVYSDLGQMTIAGTFEYDFDNDVVRVTDVDTVVLGEAVSGGTADVYFNPDGSAATITLSDVDTPVAQTMSKPEITDWTPKPQPEVVTPEPGTGKNVLDNFKTIAAAGGTLDNNIMLTAPDGTFVTVEPSKDSKPTVSKLTNPDQDVVTVKPLWEPPNGHLLLTFDENGTWQKAIVAHDKGEDGAMVMETFNASEGATVKWVGPDPQGPAMNQGTLNFLTSAANSGEGAVFTVKGEGVAGPVTADFALKPGTVEVETIAGTGTTYVTGVGQEGEKLGITFQNGTITDVYADGWTLDGVVGTGHFLPDNWDYEVDFATQTPAKPTQYAGLVPSDLSTNPPSTVTFHHSKESTLGGPYVFDTSQAVVINNAGYTGLKPVTLTSGGYDGSDIKGTLKFQPDGTVHFKPHGPGGNALEFNPDAGWNPTWQYHQEEPASTPGVQSLWDVSKFDEQGNTKPVPIIQLTHSETGEKVTFVPTPSATYTQLDEAPAAGQVKIINLHGMTKDDEPGHLAISAHSDGTFTTLQWIPDDGKKTDYHGTSPTGLGLGNSGWEGVAVAVGEDPFDAPSGNEVLDAVSNTANGLTFTVTSDAGAETWEIGQPEAGNPEYTPNYMSDPDYAKFVFGLPNGNNLDVVTKDGVIIQIDEKEATYNTQVKHFYGHNATFTVAETVETDTSSKAYWQDQVGKVIGVYWDDSEGNKNYSVGKVEMAGDKGFFLDLAAGPTGESTSQLINYDQVSSFTVVEDNKVDAPTGTLQVVDGKTGKTLDLTVTAQALPAKPDPATGEGVKAVEYTVVSGTWTNGQPIPPGTKITQYETSFGSEETTGFASSTTWIQQPGDAQPMPLLNTDAMTYTSFDDKFPHLFQGKPKGKPVTLSVTFPKGTATFHANQVGANTFHLLDGHWLNGNLAEGDVVTVTDGHQIHVDYGGGYAENYQADSVGYVVNAADAVAHNVGDQWKASSGDALKHLKPGDKVRVSLNGGKKPGSVTTGVYLGVASWSNAYGQNTPRILLYTDEYSTAVPNGYVMMGVPEHSDMQWELLGEGFTPPPPPPTTPIKGKTTKARFKLLAPYSGYPVQLQMSDGTYQEGIFLSSGKKKSPAVLKFLPAGSTSVWSAHEVPISKIKNVAVLDENTWYPTLAAYANSKPRPGGPTAIGVSQQEVEDVIPAEYLPFVNIGPTSPADVPKAPTTPAKPPKKVAAPKPTPTPEPTPEYTPPPATLVAGTPVQSVLTHGPAAGVPITAPPSPGEKYVPPMPPGPKAEAQAALQTMDTKWGVGKKAGVLRVSSLPGYGDTMTWFVGEPSVDTTGDLTTGYTYPILGDTNATVEVWVNNASGQIVGVKGPGMTADTPTIQAGQIELTHTPANANLPKLVDAVWSGDPVVVTLDDGKTLEGTINTVGGNPPQVALDYTNPKLPEVPTGHFLLSSVMSVKPKGEGQAPLVQTKQEIIDGYGGHGEAGILTVTYDTPDAPGGSTVGTLEVWGGDTANFDDNATVLLYKDKTTGAEIRVSWDADGAPNALMAEDGVWHSLLKVEFTPTVNEPLSETPTTLTYEGLTAGPEYVKFSGLGMDTFEFDTSDAVVAKTKTSVQFQGATYTYDSASGPVVKKGTLTVDLDDGGYFQSATWMTDDGVDTMSFEAGSADLDWQDKPTGAPIPAQVIVSQDTGQDVTVVSETSNYVKQTITGKITDHGTKGFHISNSGITAFVPYDEVISITPEGAPAPPTTTPEGILPVTYIDHVVDAPFNLAGTEIPDRWRHFEPGVVYERSFEGTTERLRYLGPHPTPGYGWFTTSKGRFPRAYKLNDDGYPEGMMWKRVSKKVPKLVNAAPADVNLPQSVKGHLRAQRIRNFSHREVDVLVKGHGIPDFVATGYVKQPHWDGHKFTVTVVSMDGTSLTVSARDVLGFQNASDGLWLNEGDYLDGKPSISLMDWPKEFVAVATNPPPAEWLGYFGLGDADTTVKQPNLSVGNPVWTATNYDNGFTLSANTGMKAHTWWVVQPQASHPKVEIVGSPPQGARWTFSLLNGNKLDVYTDLDGQITEANEVSSVDGTEVVIHYDTVGGAGFDVGQMDAITAQNVQETLMGGNAYTPKPKSVPEKAAKLMEAGQEVHIDYGPSGTDWYGYVVGVDDTGLTLKYKGAYPESGEHIPWTEINDIEPQPEHMDISGPPPGEQDMLKPPKKAAVKKPAKKVPAPKPKPTMPLPGDGTIPANTPTDHDPYADPAVPIVLPNGLVDPWDSSWSAKPYQPKKGGSNPGGFYTDANGKKWYIKIGMYKESYGTGQEPYKYDNRSKNEVIAIDLYKAAGVAVPDAQLVDVRQRKNELVGGDGGPEKSKAHIGLKSPIVDYDGDLKQMQHLLNDPEFMAEVRRGFAVDAWLGNWDVAGTGMDNIVIKDGHPIRIDVGGTMLYRAKGGLKEGDFTYKVDEIDTMRGQGFSTDTTKLFKSMTEDDVRDSFAQTVALVTEDQIDAIVDGYALTPAEAEELKNKLKGRRIDMAERLGVNLPDHPETDYVFALKNKKIAHLGFTSMDTYDDAVAWFGSEAAVEKANEGQSFSITGHKNIADAMSLAKETGIHDPELLARVSRSLHQVESGLGYDHDQVMARVDATGWDWPKFADTVEAMNGGPLASKWKVVAWVPPEVWEAQGKDRLLADNPWHYDHWVQQRNDDPDFADDWDAWAKTLTESHHSQIVNGASGLLDPSVFPTVTPKDDKGLHYLPTVDDVRHNNQFKAYLARSKKKWKSLPSSGNTTNAQVAAIATHAWEGGTVTSGQVHDMQTAWGGSSQNTTGSGLQWAALERFGFDLNTVEKIGTSEKNDQVYFRIYHPGNPDGDPPVPAQWIKVAVYTDMYNYRATYLSNENQRGKFLSVVAAWSSEATKMFIQANLPEVAVTRGIKVDKAWADDNPVHVYTGEELANLKDVVWTPVGEAVTQRATGSFSVGTHMAAKGGVQGTGPITVIYRAVFTADEMMSGKGPPFPSLTSGDTEDEVIAPAGVGYEVFAFYNGQVSTSDIEKLIGKGVTWDG